MKNLIILKIVFLSFLYFSGNTNAQEIWISSNGIDLNLTNGDLLVGCASVSGQFSLKNAHVIRWEYDGGISYMESPSLLFSGEGDYKVTAFYNKNGTELSISAVASVLQTPKVDDFMVSKQNGCTGTTVKFEASPNFNYQEIRFIVDGTTISNGGTYTFQKEGYYTITMEGITSEGCEFYFQKSDYINIISPFEVQISPLINNSCSNTLTETFTAVSNETNVNYTWDFGDGSPKQKGNNITHTFTNSQPITYLVKVEAEKSGCITTKKLEVNLNVTTDMMDIILPQNYCNNYEVTFNSTLPSSFNGKRIEWDFGDGTHIVDNIPSSVSHAYIKGSRSTIVTATVEGCYKQEVIQIPDLIPDNISIDSQTDFCQIPFTVSPSINNYTKLPHGYSVYWKTSDGQYSNLISPQFTFNQKNKDYTIQLVARSNTHDCMLDQITVVSKNILTTISSSNGESGCIPYTSQLTFQSLLDGIRIPLSDIQNIEWEIFHEGQSFQTSTGSVFDLDLQKEGKYDVTVKITTMNNCISFANYEIKLGRKLSPTFTISNNPVCNKENIIFKNTTIMQGVPPSEVDFQWKYNDSMSWVSSFDGEYTYQNRDQGDVNVSLRVKYNGCYSDIYTLPLKINPPKAAFSLSQSDTCQINTLQVQNNSIGSNLPYDWEVITSTNTYSFTTLDLAPFFLKDKLGFDLQEGVNYNITLNSINTNGCSDTFTDNFIRQVKPPIDIKFNNTNKSEFCTGEYITLSPGNNINGSNAVVEWELKKNGAPFIPEGLISNSIIYPTIVFRDVGEYKVKLKVTYKDGCSTNSEKNINVYNVTLKSIQGLSRVCYDTSVNGNQTFTVNTDFEYNSTYPSTFFWKWRITDNKGKEIFKEEGNDPNTIKKQITYNFIDLLSDQNDSYKIQFSIGTSDCFKSKNHLIKVSKPIVSFGNSDDHISHYFDCNQKLTYIDLKTDKSKILNPSSSNTLFLWELITQKGNINLSNYTKQVEQNGNIIFTFYDLPAGNHTLILSIMDENGCLGSDTLILSVPKLPIGIADFTSSNSQLSCRGTVSLKDNANGQNGNSIPRTRVDGSPIDVVKWIWTIKKDINNVEVITKKSGQLDYFFEAGDYEITLEVEDSQGCTYISTSKMLKVGGVKGNFTVSKKIGYIPFMTRFQGYPTYASSNINTIDYIWFVGNGYSEISESHLEYIFEDDISNDQVVKPGLIFRDDSGCEYPAQDEYNINLLKLPELKINSFYRCVSEGDTIISLKDPNFNLVNIDNMEYSYRGTQYFQWYLNGKRISSLQGGGSETITLTFGKNNNPFTVDPELINGNKYTVETWIEAEYLDKIEPSNNHTEITLVKKKDFSVVYTPVPTAHFNCKESVCKGEKVILDATSTNFLPYQNGEIIKYKWEILGLKSFETVDPITEISFDIIGKHKINLTVTGKGKCEQSMYSKDIIVNDLPIPSFLFPSTICKGEQVTFLNKTLINGMPINEKNGVKWYLEEGGKRKLFGEDINGEYEFIQEGIYKVILEIENEQGCIQEKEELINVHPLPKNTLESEFYICSGEQITITANGGESYLWNTNENSASINVSPIKDSVYTVEITSAMGCSSYQSFRINVIPNYENSIEYYEICEGESIELDGSIEYYTSKVKENYLWSDKSTDPKLIVNTSGVYTVENTISYPNGTSCIMSKDFNVTVWPLPYTYGNIDTVFCFEDNRTITLEAPNRSGVIYIWEDTGESTSSVIRSNEGLYKIILLDEETYCQSEASINITEICPATFFSPTAFSPNQDGLNDEFLIRSKYALNLELNIYNRWGEIIFSRKYPSSIDAQKTGNGWDGTYRGRLVSGGVYNYSLKYIDELDGKQYRILKSITVVL